jgi:hypothetical protein
MDPLTLALIGGGLGLLKSGQDEAAAKKQNLLNAQIMRYSPWTHMTPSAQQGHGDQLGNVMQGAFTGAALGQSMGKDAAAGAENAAAAGSYNPETYGSFDPNTGLGQPNVLPPVTAYRPNATSDMGINPWALRTS